MKRPLLVLWWLMILSGSGYGKISSSDTTNAFQSSKKAVAAIEAGNIELASQNWRMAAENFSQSGHAVRAAECWLELAQTLLLAYHLDDANKALESALKWWEKTPTEQTQKLYISIRHTQAEALFHRANHDGSLQVFQEVLTMQKARPSTSAKDLIDTYNWIGMQHQFSFDYQSAAENYELALEVAQSSSEPETEGKSLSYFNLGCNYADMGDYEKGTVYHHKALNLLLEHFGPDHEKVPEIYNKLGSAYQDQGQYDTALVYMQKAQDFWREKWGDFHPHIALMHNNMGWCHQMNDHYEKARYHYHSCLKIIEKSMDKDIWYQAIPLTSLAEVYIHLDKLEEVLPRLERSTEIYVRHFGEHHYNLGNVYRVKGDYLYKSGHYQKALAYYQQALDMVTDLPLDTSIYAFPELTNISFHNVVIDALRGKTKAFNKLYLESGKQQDLEAALTACTLNVNWLDTLRTQMVSTEGAKLRLSSNLRSSFRGGIEAAYQLFDLTQDPVYPDIALDLAERSRSFLLLEALRSSKARHFSGVPDHILEKEQTLKRERALCQRMLKGGKGKVDWQKRLIQATLSLDEFRTELQRNYPNYYRLVYEQPSLSVARLREQGLAKGSVLLDVFQSRSAFYLLAISKDQLVWRKVPFDGEWRPALESLQKSLWAFDPGKEGAVDQFLSDAHMVYQHLLSSLEKVLGPSVKQLIIVPDGQLHYLPFEVLVDQPPVAKESSLKNAPYLLRRFGISYSYSAHLLVEEPLSLTPKGSLMAMAPDFGQAASLAHLRSGQKGAAPLSFNQEEVNRIHSLIHGQAITGNGATEEVFKSEAARHRVLHLATHAFTDDQNPMLSRLAFAPPSGDEDGWLHAYELYNLELQADLVVLSACNTGFGKWVRGEGVMSLARGFAFAGCPSVAMSLWEVNDQATSELMEYFYAGLAQGLSKDEALRQAKLSYLESVDELRAHPFSGPALCFREIRSHYPDWIKEVNTRALWGLGLAVLVLAGAGAGWSWKQTA